MGFKLLALWPTGGDLQLSYLCMCINFLVPVCKAAWYDNSNCFVAGFIDGVICLATKDPNDQVKTIEAHKVSTFNRCLYSSDPYSQSFGRP